MDLIIKRVAFIETEQENLKKKIQPEDHFLKIGLKE